MGGQYVVSEQAMYQLQSGFNVCWRSLPGKHPPVHTHAQVQLDPLPHQSIRQDLLDVSSLRNAASCLSL